MKLLDRLKPEFRKQLDEQEVEFPTIIGNIKASLTNNTSIIQITVEEAIMLLGMASNNALSFENLESLFNEYKFN
tara:strand:+ start:538 stop:762 length:225 start_codon:yes stop_codon:yes gene_type:complete